MNNKQTLDKYMITGKGHSIGKNITAFDVLLADIVSVCCDFYFDRKFQLKTIFAVDDREKNSSFKIYYVFGVPGQNIFYVPYISISGPEEFPSITKEIHEASGYERKIKTFFGLEPVGHPQPRTILLHENWPAGVFPLRKDFDGRERPAEVRGVYDFQKVKGDGVYEIPVGPVHAGIIEPGHFRFSVAGEEIILLEPKLGYKHKGIEKLFETLSLEEKVKLSERVSGDSSFTHSLAFCQAIEDLTDIIVPDRAKYLRTIFSELERLANHLNDIGFMMLDTGYSFGGSAGSRLREMIMLANERLTGSRFLRGVNVIGGVAVDISPTDCRDLLVDLEKIERDFEEIISIAEDSSTVVNRMLGTGKLDHQLALDHGLVGVAGRAVSIEHDARIEYPYAAYNKIKFDIALETGGDVRSRFLIRIKEVRSCLSILSQTLNGLSQAGPVRSLQEIRLKADTIAIGIAEGFRGDIVYSVITDEDGKITRVDVRDPSFINWTVLGHAGLGNVVPDFPLINKSFNLSYSGNDL